MTILGQRIVLVLTAWTLLSANIASGKDAGLGCGELLNPNGGELHKSRLTASYTFSSHDTEISPHYPEPFADGDRPWCASTVKEGEFLIIDLGGPAEINGISVSGYHSNYVSVYRVKHSMDGIEYSDIMYGSQAREFYGPLPDFDRPVDHAVKEDILPHIKARYLKILPTTISHAGRIKWCMRFEVHGCI